MDKRHKWEKKDDFTYVCKICGKVQKLSCLGARAIKGLMSDDIVQVVKILPKNNHLLKDVIWKKVE